MMRIDFLRVNNYHFESLARLKKGKKGWSEGEIFVEKVFFSSLLLLFR